MAKHSFDRCWKTFFLTANKFFRTDGSTDIVLGGLSIQSDTTHVIVTAIDGQGGTDKGVYSWEIGLTSVEGMRTKTPYIPMPGIVFEGGMLVDIGNSPGVTVIYKGDIS